MVYSNAVRRDNTFLLFGTDEGTHQISWTVQGLAAIFSIIETGCLL